MVLFSIANVFAWNVLAGMVHATPAAFDAFARAAAPLAVAALWQGVLVAAGLAICLRLAPRISAAHRFAVWAAGFAVLVCLPFLPHLAHLAARVSAETAAGTPAGAGASLQPWFQLDARWSFVLAALWLVLSAFRMADLIVHSFRLRKLWRSATPIDETMASALAASPVFQGVISAEICSTDSLDRPSVIGFLAPRILIPGWLLACITREELEQVVLHEAEHLRRHDDWTNLFQKLCLVLFPLNPALAWIEHRLSKEREMACDEDVVRRTRAPRAYAACLASLAERGLEQNLDHSVSRRAAAALSLGAWHRRPELVHRVHSILLRKHTLNPVAARALLATVGCGLLAGSVELARCPQVVAFVPAHAAVRAESAQLMPADLPMNRIENRAETGQFARTSGFRAINAEAIMPAATHRAAPSRAMSRSRVTSRSLAMNNLHSRRGEAKPVEAAANVAQLRMLNAEAFSGSSTGAAPKSTETSSVESQPDQQWIVLTTWEQMETPAPDSGTVADYDSDAANKPAPGQAAAKTANRFTVTRLILRVYPVNQAANKPVNQPVNHSVSQSADGHSASSSGKPANPDARLNQGSRSASNSVINRPSTFALGDGWLVIQL